MPGYYFYTHLFRRNVHNSVRIHDGLAAVARSIGRGPHVGRANDDCLQLEVYMGDAIKAWRCKKPSQILAVGRTIFG
jgi:plasmid stabilization system protein ParE